MQLLGGKNLSPRCWNGGSPPSLHQLSLPVVFLRAGGTSLAGSGEGVPCCRQGWGSRQRPPRRGRALTLPCVCLAASLFIIAMLLASLNSCCNPWIYMLYTGHLFHDLMRRFLCCSTRYLKSRPACDLGKKSNSSSFVLSCRSTSQRSFMQPCTT